jgi:ABC-type multidrug transport system fused ATPase/permease subunit
VESNRYLAAIYHSLGFASRDGFLLFLGVAVFLVLVATLVLRALGGWVQVRYAQQRNHTWASRLVGGYLGQPYEWFLNRHSGELTAGVLTEVEQVVNGSLVPALQAVANVLVAACLLGLLLAVDPVLALGAAAVLGGLYGAVVYFSRARLRQIGLERRTAGRARFRLLQEALGGVKDVKVGGLERSYALRFAEMSQRFTDTRIASNLISQLPSYAMQGILFGGMLLAVLYLMATHGDFQGALPVVSVFAFAGYRLMPALQAVYNGVVQMRFSEPALDSLCEDLRSVPPLQDTLARLPGSGAGRTPLRESVELADVWYTYPEAAHPTLRGVTLRIPARTTAGFVGSTGSGKTTVVDVVLGLLRAQKGSLLVDGVEVTDANIRSWQCSVGYVPQQIFLVDDSVEANIAFGVPATRIDKAAVEWAARIAGLHDFVTQELPAGYATMVGERGVRLSGGQRQRIGIARALYRDPELLILDEATSALDNLTERAVMEAVHNLSGSKTIVLIAHRLSTVRGCDSIHLLEQGEVLASGSFDHLVAESPRFRAMAELA